MQILRIRRGMLGRRDVCALSSAHASLRTLYIVMLGSGHYCGWFGKKIKKYIHIAFLISHAVLVCVKSGISTGKVRFQRFVSTGMYPQTAVVSAVSAVSALYIKPKQPKQPQTAGVGKTIPVAGRGSVHAPIGGRRGLSVTPAVWGGISAETAEKNQNFPLGLGNVGLEWDWTSSVTRIPHLWCLVASWLVCPFILHPSLPPHGSWSWVLPLPARQQHGPPPPAQAQPLPQ